MAKRDRRRKVTPAMIRRMKKLREEGLPYEEIAKGLNLATMTVFNYLKKKEKVGFFERLRRKLGLK
jgi:DNA-binding CsgD family transcriptional regulator